MHKPIFNFEGVIPAGLNDSICILKHFGEPGPLLLELMNGIISIIRQIEVLSNSHYSWGESADFKLKGVPLTQSNPRFKHSLSAQAESFWSSDKDTCTWHPSPFSSAQEVCCCNKSRFAKTGGKFLLSDSSEELQMFFLRFRTDVFRKQSSGGRNCFCWEPGWWKD